MSRGDEQARACPLCGSTRCPFPTPCSGMILALSRGRDGGGPLGKALDDAVDALDAELDEEDRLAALEAKKP